MSAKRTKDMLTVAVLLAAAAAAIHFYVDNMARNAAWHALYPLRAKLALSKLSCSPGSPAWMEGALRLSVERQVAPANQIAYIDAQGREFHCENGFFDKPYLSDAVTEQTRFRYASMTKLWTADAVLALVNENKIGLDTKAVDILPEIRNQTDPRMNDITVAHLLLHQGGFDRYSMLGIDMFNPNEEPLCPNHLAELGTIRLNFTPGSRTSYSNLGYCLLGEIVARKSGGGTYTEAMGRLYPLAQDGLKFIRQQQESDEVSYNYVEKGLTGLADIYSSFDYAAAASAAGLSGSALGAAKEIRAMLAREKLNITSLPENVSCNLAQMRGCYGYAMFPYRENGRSLVWFRDGNLPAASSVAMVDGEGGVTVLLASGWAESPAEGADEIKRFIYRSRF